jgi:hypothetical protein
MIGDIFAASPARPARIVITVPSGDIARIVLAALRSCAAHAPVQVRGYLLGASLETGR